MANRTRKTEKFTDTFPAEAQGLSLLNEHALRVATEQLQERDEWQLERDQLLEERSWLRAMIDQVPDYLFVKDRECRFVIANRAVAADLGRTPETIIGLTDIDLHPPERAQEFISDDRRVIESGRAMIDKEEFVILPSGQHRWLSTSKLPLRDDTGAIVGLVGVARDITLRRQAEDQVRFLAYYDPLTKLPNRSSFEANFYKVSQSLGPDSEARLILIDLDHFKQVNDTLGHAAGDKLLQSVAERLSQFVAGRGHLARIGGDEFALVMSFATADEEERFCDALIGQLRVFTIMGNNMHVGASVGVSKVLIGTTPLAALREADIALYEAKSKGRNRWQAFEGKMSDLLETRQRLESDLRNALPGGDQFRVVYQPIYDIKGKTVLGVEALVRWQHPELGVLSPDQFISIAEDHGLILELGAVVLRRTCDLLSRTALPWAAVNVSPVELRDDSFVDRVLSLLRDNNVSASRLQLEITEGVLLEEIGTARGALDKLRSAGVRIAIDDFGTGYSSLSYLGRLAVDKIKIDRSFVDAIGTPNADAIVRAVIAFAKALCVTVTAEGVETQEQRRFLAEADCDELQGFLLSRPVDERDL
jgi:diguanylate cyclase (GGDEF)-like protein/PAS domain S-box-containing protein